MQVVKCRFGHHYDADQFESCPHCNANAGASQRGTASAGSPSQKNDERGLFIDFSGTYKKGNDDATLGIYQRNCDEKASIPQKDKGTPQSTLSQDDIMTVGLFHQEINSLHNGEIGFRERTRKNEQNLVFSTDTGSISVSHSVSCSSQITSFQESHDPIVGWLVCVKGPHWGESFEIRSGENTIGKYGDNGIPLQYDASVTDQNHAVVHYHTDKDMFYITPYSFCVLNGKQINSITRLKNGDILQIGQCSLRLHRLCGKYFSWNDYPKEER